MTTRIGTTKYSKFCAELADAWNSYVNDEPLPQSTAHLINGAASSALTKHVSSTRRAKDGIFFSGQKLARQVASRIESRLLSGATVIDPTCGAGDLLLACAENFRLSGNASDAFKEYKRRLRGVDKHQSFVLATKLRLALLAASKFPRGAGELAANFEIACGDVFEQLVNVGNADCVVMNPPFGDVIAPNDCTWSSGKTQLAALIVDRVLESAKVGQEIVAVLPDVLRSGTRYARWRKTIYDRAEVCDAEVYGRFDARTDVDVFILHMVKAANSTASNSITNQASLQADSARVCVGDFFSVSVGAVVPHRHKGDVGSWQRYLTPESAPICGEIAPKSSRRFKGRTNVPPFVVMRRTSSPGDSRRAIPTVVVGSDPVAVENHLLVLTPYNGDLEICRKLSAALSAQDVQDWLDEAIRCRHLTTEVVRKIPLIGWSK